MMLRQLGQRCFDDSDDDASTTQEIILVEHAQCREIVCCDANPKFVVNGSIRNLALGISNLQICLCYLRQRIT
ncbi:hypothetical protein BC938DRAFT_477871 [Jimgerdemannia flammicorona]|uniref:Uncharacterized protein n=1 Tax=Jimgerdemannia flammicorona TaxID=994334 RepID=A0A433QNQ7_9FUNG|nr:hypothetical protein BC938DRAFT_477871 [Jimgerdemannia flammicorona]